MDTIFEILLLLYINAIRTNFLDGPPQYRCDTKGALNFNHRKEAVDVVIIFPMSLAAAKKAAEKAVQKS